MATKEEKSLLELAIELLEKKTEPQTIDSIIKEVMAAKGYKAQEAKDHAAQFVMDFMLSGNFVYCGEDKWDLKYRQPTSVLDKDGGDYEDFYADDDDVKNNELKDDTFDEYDESSIQESSDEDDDEDDDKNDDSEDLSNEFEDLVGSVEDEDDEEEEDEEDY